MSGTWAADDPAAALVFLADLGARVRVEGPDGHHLARVRRLGPAERVTGADGAGSWRPYEVERVAAGALELVARGGVRREPDPALGLVAVPALVKAGLDDAIAALTALGVAAIRPWTARRSVVRIEPDRARRLVDRWRRVARESAMQARRARIPDVAPPAALADVVAGASIAVADREGAAPATVVRPPVSGSSPTRWTVVTGPEGGFAPEEATALAGAVRFAVGPHVLRAEHAPIAACAALLGAVGPAVIDGGGGGT